jgi:DNA-binding SARP family transcriptional activator
VLPLRVLGPLEVRGADGRVLAIRRRKQRALLALLIVRGGRPTSADEVIWRLWGDDPPRSARANVYTYLSDLRRLLGEAVPEARLRTDRALDGYTLDVTADTCDAPLFEQLARDGRRAMADGRAADAADVLGRALGLWRGPVLEDIEPSEWLTPFADRLELARVQALEDQAEARLRLGQHRQLADELAELTERHPLRERLWQHYLVALHGAGRRTDALAAYQRMRETLRDELGTEPGPAAEDISRRIERDEVIHLDGAFRPPALLPPDVADFTGRAPELAVLRELIPRDAARAALPIAGITGMAGVGKTTLAVHAAHLAAAAYPDGQLYVNLGGAAPDEVLGRFLRALGVDSRAVPAGFAERAELYRTLLANRRALVVLDNAADEAQVRPLLPGSATCAVLITSRTHLTGLESARWLDLDPFPPDEALRLLSRVVRDGRTRAQSDDAAEIVRLCGSLPLAIRIAGARLTARPGWRLAHLVALLKGERHRLDQLTTGDLEVSASLALSYDGLDPAARRLFRRLGQFDLPDFTAWLADAVHGEPAAEALERLVDRHLLTVIGTDPAGQLRFRFHDLVRLYARSRAEPADLPAVPAGLGALLAVADTMADACPGPCFARISGPAERTPVDRARHGLTGLDPLTWFDAERPALLAAVEQACTAGLDDLAFDLAGCLEKYFDMRGMYADWEQLNRRVLETCRASGNRLGEATMLRGLIDVTTWSTNDHGSEAMTRSLPDATRLQAMFAELGERPGMSDAAVMRAWALTAAGAHEPAIAAATDALRWADESGHLGGRARAHVALAVVLGEQLAVADALAHLHAALADARTLGNARYEATVLQFLGIAHRELGQLDQSARFLGESLAISRRYHDDYTEVLTLLALARLELRRGDPGAGPAAESALAMARKYRMSHHVAEALGLLGEIALAEGDRESAVAYFGESVSMWRTRGWLSYQAAALALLGEAQAGLDPAAARAAFTEARELFDRLGHAARRDGLDERLAGLG